MIKRVLVTAIALMSSSMGQLVLAQDQQVVDSFQITRFQVEGNTLLQAATVERLVAPYTGKSRVYGDVQKALEALESAYRAAGYGTVQVYVPEQELTQGIVRLKVTEGVIGKVTIEGNKFSDEARVRNSLPALQVGKAPNMRLLSENVQLANENPAKQVEVTLGVSEEEGKVDARIKVTDEDPQRFMVIVENGGTKATGFHRASLIYRHANVFGGDEAMTLVYNASLDAPAGVKSEVYSAAFRIPMYSIGDSLDLTYTSSRSNIPPTAIFGPTAAPGALSISGQGESFGVRWNHYFPREGEFTHRIVFGLDQKYQQNPCSTGTGVGCVSTAIRPLSVAYSGQWLKPGMLADFNFGVSSNVPIGNANESWRYSYAAGGRPTSTDLTKIYGGASYLSSLPQDYQLRFALSAQHSWRPLPNSEQLFLSGPNAVRGMTVGQGVDTGFVANLEAYTPDFASSMGINSGSLRALAFYDIGRGRNTPGNGASGDPAGNSIVDFVNATGVHRNIGVSSVGAGLRFALAKDISLRTDFAYVLNANPTSPGSAIVSDDKWRTHFSFMAGF